MDARHFSLLSRYTPRRRHDTPLLLLSHYAFVIDAAHYAIFSPLRCLIRLLMFTLPLFSLMPIVTAYTICFFRCFYVAASPRR